MLLDAILKAITEIEAMNKPTKEMERVLKDLKDTVNTRMKESLMDFMSVGEKMGYDDIKRQLNDLLGFINSIEEKGKEK
ncbi:hypothetical protein [Abyssalbus ytuae]|uniref:Uncharacterized protein n=1 Tax=Abyssalbus ytuae TaxID=2926907 RepID=A0A9E7A2Q7_9FLAO|nr:hypothetical protein [Abyssalbus ytuae]UOB18726.1 hypothetical protein MQE35_05395 [Abyssalbus ytuae]